MGIILDEHKNVKVGDASFRTTETSVRLMKTLELRKLRKNPAQLLGIRY